MYTIKSIMEWGWGPHADGSHFISIMGQTKGGLIDVLWSLVCEMMRGWPQNNHHAKQ